MCAPIVFLTLIWGVWLLEMETGLLLSETGEVALSSSSTAEQGYMHWRSYLTWAAFRLGAHHTPSDDWGQGGYPMGYWHGQRDKWRCLSGAIWQCNSSYLLLVLKGGVKRNTILYLAGSACAFQIRGIFGCTTSWKSALKMILGDICWFCDLSSMQLWFPAAVS